MPRPSRCSVLGSFGHGEFLQSNQAVAAVAAVVAVAALGCQYGFSAMNVPTYGPPDRREHPAESALQSFAWNQSLHPPGIGMSPDEHGGMVFAFLSCKLG